MPDWDVLMFLADDKCPDCGAEGVFQNMEDGVVSYYCPAGCGYFSVDVSKDQSVIEYLSSKQTVTSDKNV